jgi:basic amino acid/polyamine antiporter, APA family
MTQEPTSLLPIWARTPTTRRPKSRRHQLPIPSDAMEEARDHRLSSTAGRPFLSGFCAAALRRKPLGARASAAAAATGEGLVRQLGVLDLVLLGIGASIGAGIFVVTGTVARDAGPGQPTLQLRTNLNRNQTLLLLLGPGRHLYNVYNESNNLLVSWLSRSSAMAQ